MEEAASPLTHESLVLEEDDGSSIEGSERSTSHLTISSEESLPDRLFPLLDSPEAESPLPRDQTEAEDFSNVQQHRKLSGVAQQAKLLYAERCTLLHYLCREGSGWGIVK